MTEEPKDCCAVCKYSLKPEGNLDDVLCRRFPPIVAIHPDGSPRIMFPAMKTIGWCGEFVRKLVLHS